MHGLILAAARRAIGPDGEPVCLSPLAGQSLIGRQIAALRGGGVTEIGVVRGYRAEAIDVPDVTWFDHPRWEETGEVMELCAAAAWLRGGTVIVSDSNIFYRHELVHALGTVRGTLVVGYDRAWRALWARRFADPLAHVAAFRRGPAGNLLDIGGKAEQPDIVQGQPLGLLKVTPTAWQAVEAFLDGLDQMVRDHLDTGSLLHWMLDAKAVAIGTVGTDGQCGRVESATDLTLYEQMVAAGDMSLDR